APGSSTGTLTSRSVYHCASTSDHASAPAPAAASTPRPRRAVLTSPTPTPQRQSSSLPRPRSRPRSRSSSLSSSLSSSRSPSRSSSQPLGGLPRPFHFSHGSGLGPLETLSVMTVPLATRAPEPTDCELILPF